MVKYFGNTSFTKLLNLLKSQFNTKVDKVNGKALSTNDFTTEYKNKLDGIAAGANKYTHPTTTGNKHIPSGGSAGQILRWSSDGTAVWGEDQNTTYSTGTASTEGLTKLYTELGTNTDGTMTQAAINSAIETKISEAIGAAIGGSY